MAKNVSREIYEAVVQGLLKDDDWSVEDRNFEHYDTIEGTQDPSPITLADGDYPHAVLEGPVAFGTKLRTTDESFATYSVDTPQNWVESGEVTLRLTVTSDLLRLSDYTSLATESINAIRKLGPQLGLPYVSSVTATGGAKEERDHDNGVKRIVITILITVKYEADGAELTGA